MLNEVAILEAFSWFALDMARWNGYSLAKKFKRGQDTSLWHVKYARAGNENRTATKDNKDNKAFVRKSKDELLEVYANQGFAFDPRALTDRACDMGEEKYDRSSWNYFFGKE
jgi:hypothetical protein